MVDVTEGVAEGVRGVHLVDEVGALDPCVVVGRRLLYYPHSLGMFLGLLKIA